VSLRKWRGVIGYLRLAARLLICAETSSICTT
jgi:hypothetical protein